MPVRADSGRIVGNSSTTPATSGSSRLRLQADVNDPKFEGKVRDVVGLYVDPPDRALVALH
jgi:hypothetical protein